MAVLKAETRAQELNTMLADLTIAKTLEETKAAVAERYAMDLNERIAELTAQAAAQAEALQKRAVAAEQLLQDVTETRKLAAEADKRAALAERRAADLGERVAELAAQTAIQTEALQKSALAAEQLRQDVTETRKVAADADKRAALAE